MKNMFASAMDDAPVGISIADPTAADCPLIYVNDGFLELTGYRREEVLGRNCRFLQGEHTREEPVTKLRTAITNEQPVTVMLRNYRKDGTMFWNRVTLSPVRDRTGTVTQFLGYQEDVTDLKKREAENQLFRQHAEVTDHAMLVTDTDGTIEYVNPAFERITGYTASEVLGQNPRILKSGHHDEQFYRELWETITAGDIWEAELTNRRKSGELYQVRQRIVPVTNEYDKITNFVAIEEDISNTVFTDQALTVMSRILRHNVRNSINVIDIHAELLAEQLDDSTQETAALTIHNHTAALEKMSEKAALVQRLLNRGETSHSMTVDAVTTAVEAFQTTHPAARISLSVELDPETQVPSGSLLEIALEEALENAVEHADRHPPSVEVRVSSDTGDGLDGDVHAPLLRIDIADDGPGIPDEEWRVLSVGKETPLYHGSGLGLWLMYWVTHALGGTLLRTENEPRGTVITILVPLVPSVPSS